MSVFLSIATLINSNLPHDDLISFLNKVESTSLKQYLTYANIYTDSRVKSKNQLIEMTIYGFMCDKINNIPSIDVSDKGKLKKKQQKNVKLILKNSLDMVIVTKQKETC